MEEGEGIGDRSTPMALAPQARCPTHHAALGMADRLEATGTPEIRGSCGCVFAIRNGIPRFVADSAYTTGFGLQWNAFRRTQLDSFSGARISHDRLTRCMGGSLDELRGAAVLEVGCGAGRFTEVLLHAGARVFACDLSTAVEANYANCGGNPGYFVCQADVLRLPIAPAGFDVVVALGMIQHTPSPEATIQALAAAVRPGGLLVLDHYRTPPPLIRLAYPLSPHFVLRQVLLRVPPPLAIRLTRAIVHALLPFHRRLWHRGPVADRLGPVWRRLSPVFDYYDSYPELGDQLAEWAFLDTHDGLTDHYKHLRTPEQIAAALRAAGLEVIECRPGGNGVEARARRPDVTTGCGPK